MGPPVAGPFLPPFLSLGAMVCVVGMLMGEMERGVDE